jgi:predicted lipid-binding transport protein (Tim44 family)
MTPRKRRILLITAVVALIALIVVPIALAAGGSGSAGFGGGGGEGGGGGGGGGGKGFFLYLIFRAIIDLIISTHGVARIIVIVLIAAVIAYVVFGARIRAWSQAQRDQGHAARRKTAKRERRVELAAAEAADEDPMFSPDNVRAAGKRLFTEVQAAWSNEDRIRLRALVAPELLNEWERRLDDLDQRGWHNRVSVIGEPTVSYVGLQRTGKAHEDRVVVKIEAKLRDYVEDRNGRHLNRSGRLTETVHIREFWTLGKRAGHWILTSIEQGGEGEHALDTKLVATPWSDDQALQDEALTEQAVADAVPEGTKITDVADLDFAGDARAAANDLSLADGRFAPDLLEIAARRAVEAWAIAIDGDDQALRKVASSPATAAMLHPSPGRRLVVRGPEIQQITITGLDAAADPPTMSIEVKIKGRRYVENRNTAAVISGSRSKEVEFVEHWTLALDGDESQPWRIVAVGEPLARA